MVGVPALLDYFAVPRAVKGVHLALGVLRNVSGWQVGRLDSGWRAGRAGQAALLVRGCMPVGRKPPMSLRNPSSPLTTLLIFLTTRIIATSWLRPTCSTASSNW